MEVNKVICDDCLEAMKDIPDKSINLVCIDPPYNIGKAKWDKWKRREDYIQWMGQVFKECERVLKDNGSFYFFHNDFLQIVELQNWLNKNSRFVFKQLITWNKISEKFSNIGFVQQRLSNGTMKNYYNGFTEYCLYYTFQDETGLTTVMLDTNNFPTLRQYFKEFQEALGLSLKEINRKLGDRKAEHAFYWKTTQWDLPTKETYCKLLQLPLTKPFKRQQYESLRQQYESLRYAFNVAYVKNNLRSNSNVWLYPPAKRTGHFTPKPVPLMENIILHSSNPNDIVLDCFLGSGTTAIAALNTGRFFIGIEKSEEYCCIAEKRIQEWYNNKSECLF